MIPIPIFYEAGVLRGEPIGGPYPFRKRLIGLDDTTPENIGVLKELATDGRASLDFTFSAPLIAQLLAKIALGIAVAEYGIDGFTPLVRDFILSKPEQYGHWVGGPGDHPEPNGVKLHEIEICERDTPYGKFIVVTTRLFARYGAPSNYVVAGRLS